MPNKLYAFWNRNLHMDLWKFLNGIYCKFQLQNQLTYVQNLKSTKCLIKSYYAQIIHSSNLLVIYLTDSVTFSSAILQVVQNDTTGARQIMSLRRKYPGRQEFLGKKNKKTPQKTTTTFFQNKLLSAAFWLWQNFLSVVQHKLPNCLPYIFQYLYFWSVPRHFRLLQLFQAKSK